MVTYFVLNNISNRFLGSVLSEADTKVMNAYGWGVQFHKNSSINLFVKFFGVPHLGARMRNRILENIINKRNHKNSTLFDAGCGIGLTSMYLSNKFEKIYAVDVEEQKIKVAKMIAKNNHINNIEFRKVDVLKDKIASKTFDFVICFEVLEHVDNEEEFIYKLSKLVKKNGVMILSFPSKTLLSRMAQKSLDHHKSGYSSDEIKKIAKKLKLKVVEEQSFGKSILGKLVVGCDFIFRITFTPLASLFFPVFYPLLILDYYLPKFGIPRGYILVIHKN